MPEDDPLIDLGIRLRFVVEANAVAANARREHWETNLDVRKINFEVFMARNFLQGLSLLLYFSDDEQAPLRPMLRSRGLWQSDNTPSEGIIQQLAQGNALAPLFRDLGINDYEPSSYLTFEVSGIAIGNSIKLRANAKARRSKAEKQELWNKTLQVIKIALALVTPSVIGSLTINFNLASGSAVPREVKAKDIVNESPAEPPTAEVSTEFYQDSRYTKIVENLMHPDRSKFAVEAIQELLFNFGIDCGPIDGVPGERFKRAVAEFKNIKRVFPITNDWRQLSFIQKLVEEAQRSESKGKIKNLKPPSPG